MNITLQISDSAYQRLVSSGSRIQGTIGLINPTEGGIGGRYAGASYAPHRAGRGGRHPLASD